MSCQFSLEGGSQPWTSEADISWCQSSSPLMVSSARQDGDLRESGKVESRDDRWRSVVDSAEICDPKPYLIRRGIRPLHLHEVSG